MKMMRFKTSKILTRLFLYIPQPLKNTNVVALSAVYVKLVITQSRQSIVLVDLDVGVFASCVECTSNSG